MKRVSDVPVTKQVSPPFLWDHSGVTEKVRTMGDQSAPFRNSPRNLFSGFEFELGNSSIEVSVGLLQRFDVSFTCQVFIRIRDAQPQPFRRSMQASGKFCESSVSGHSPPPL